MRQLSVIMLKYSGQILHNVRGPRFENPYERDLTRVVVLFYRREIVVNRWALLTVSMLDLISFLTIPMIT
jgi:hypothetical protein